MKTLIQILAVILVLTAAQAEPPYISYIYPAGAQAGTDCQIAIGGRNLRTPQAVYITDKTAACNIIEYIPPIRPLRDDNAVKFRERLAPIYKKFNANGQQPLSSEDAAALKDQLPEYPDNSPLSHPLLRDIEDLNPTELQDIVQRFYGRKRTDAQFSERVSVKVSIRANAKPGMYEIRLLSANGLSNPLNFQIDKIPEHKEREPNDKKPYNDPLNTPFVLNGQIMPGDIDMFQFNANKGETLVIETNARSLKPYMADAVPGWFQAVVSVYDVDGKELAFCDDYLFNPDPVIFFEVPRSDTYTIKINDSIYRGREDFVYRISVSQKPFITSVFPIGTSSGINTAAKITGWNLPKDTIELDGTGRNSTRTASVRNNDLHSNEVLYAVDKLPACFDAAGNDSIKNAQSVSLPVIIDGRIENSGETDFFCFDADKGDKVVIEVNARRLHSPLDSAIGLYDSQGKEIAFNDDFKNKAAGLQTHHADSYIMTELPESGKYYVKIFDIRNEGGVEYTYRLRISAPMPSYDLRITPSSIALPAGQTVALRVDVLAKDCFNDDIMLGLKSMPPANYKLGGGKIPAGKESILITITAPPNLKQPSELTIESRAKTEYGIVNITAVAAENLMQAFAYYQLVPTLDLLATPQDTKFAMPAFEARTTDVKLTPGQTAALTFTNRNNVSLKNRNITAALLTETEHLKITDTQITAEGIIINVLAAEDCPIGYKDNIVAGLKLHTEFKRKDGTVQKQTTSLNELPAVTVEIIAKKAKT